MSKPVLTVRELATIVADVMEAEANRGDDDNARISGVVIMAKDLLASDEGIGFYPIYAAAIISASKVVDSSPLRVMVLSAAPTEGAVRLTFHGLAGILTEALQTDPETAVVATASPIANGDDHQTIIALRYVCVLHPPEEEQSSLFALIAGDGDGD